MRRYVQLCLRLLLLWLIGAAPVWAQGPVLAGRAPTVTDACREHDSWINTGVTPRETYIAVDCSTPGAYEWQRTVAAVGGVLFANLPTSPTSGDTAFVMDLADDTMTCSGGGDGSKWGWCWWDNDSGLWRRDSPGSLQAIFGESSFPGFTDIPCTNPFTIQPEYATLGEESPRYYICGQAGNLHIWAETGPLATPTPLQLNAPYIPIGGTWSFSYDTGAGDATPAFCSNPAGTLICTGWINQVLAGTITVTRPMVLMNVLTTDANAFVNVVDGTNFDYRHVHFEDAVTGCAIYAHKVQADLAATPAWNLVATHRRLVDKGAAATTDDVILTVTARTPAAGEAWDNTMTPLVTTTAYDVQLAANVSVSNMSGTNLDATLTIAAGDMLVVNVCRVGGNAGDTLNEDWSLIDLSIRYDVNS